MSDSVTVDGSTRSVSSSVFQSTPVKKRVQSFKSFEYDNTVQAEWFSSHRRYSKKDFVSISHIMISI